MYISSNNSLVILDISDPTNISKINQYTHQGYGSGIGIQFNILYAGFSDGLAVLNISNEQNIIEKYFLNLSSPISDLKIVDSLLYYTNNGFDIMDITNETYPVDLTFYTFDGPPLKFDLKENLAYVANQNYGIRVIKITFGSSVISESSFISDLKSDSSSLIGFQPFIVMTIFFFMYFSLKIRNKR